MIFNHLEANLPVKDQEFDSIYSEKIKRLSKCHWTPIDVAKKAAKFLVTGPDSKVLDIGSGAGKFCLVGSTITSGQFLGVEQRANLVTVAQDIVKQYKLDRVHFINANILNIKFKNFTSFYLFNSFFENIDKVNSIDKNVLLSYDNFCQYEKYVYSQLEIMPAGTRFAAYQVMSSQIPPCYKIQDEYLHGLLRCFIKETTV